MKRMSWLIAIVVAGVLAFPLQAAEADQLKADLIGHTMGGRERSWKFQSVDQIKDLVIKSKIEDAQKRVYTIALELQSAQGTGKFAADARVEYGKTAAGWKIKQVGLLALRKMD